MSQSTHNQARHWVLIPAAGVGKRMEAACPKQYLPLFDQTILEHTLSIFLGDERFSGIYLGLSKDDAYWPESPLYQHQSIETFDGGDERVDTVSRGLIELTKRANERDWVWVHDAARPCLSPEDIEALEGALDNESCGALLAVKIHDTVKYAGDSDCSEKTVDRERLWRAMTPQVFRIGDLNRALGACAKDNVFVTDDASAMEYVGKFPVLVSGSTQNIKITRPEDLAVAERNLRGYTGVSRSQLPRIGSGFDVHAFEEGDHVTLGGVRIPHSQGLKAHSDGDVLLHALADALLGALALGDIGKHFPDTDPRWKGADSRMLLRGVYDLVRERGYEVGNVDLTVIAQAPKMAPHIQAIQDHVAQDLCLDSSDVGVKATTTEKLGFTGRKEGIAAQAVVMLIPYE